MHADKEDSARTRSSGALAQLPGGSPASSALMQAFGVPRRVMSKSPRTQTCPTFF